MELKNCLYICIDKSKQHYENNFYYNWYSYCKRSFANTNEPKDNSAISNNVAVVQYKKFKTIEDKIKWLYSVIVGDITVAGLTRSEAKRKAIALVEENIKDSAKQTHYLFSIAIADSVYKDNLK